MFKFVVIILFALIFASLGFALFTLVKDRGRTRRTVNALTARIVLSIAVVLVLLLGFLSGAIAPHGIVPSQTSPQADQKPAYNQ